MLACGFTVDAVINCILGPHYPGNSQPVARTCLEIFKKLCPRRPGTYPRPAALWMSESTELNPWARYTSDQGAQGCGAGPVQGFIRKKKTCSHMQYSGCTFMVTKYKIKSPGKFLLSPGGGGGWDTVDSCITTCTCL